MSFTYSRLREKVRQARMRVLVGLEEQRQDFFLRR
jgi:hypothetical protein